MKAKRARTVSSIYFDGSFDSYGPMRKFIGDSLLAITLDRDSKYSLISIGNDLCDLTVFAGEMIQKDQHGKFSVKKGRSKKGLAGDL